MVKMLRRLGPQIDTNAKNGRTDKRAKIGKLVKWGNGKTGGGENGKNVKTGRAGNWCEL